jgi:RHS repeat-associated protein
VAEPSFNPGGGSFTSTNPVTVTITTATSGANIRYTVDGTNPTVTYGTLIASTSGTASVTPALYTHPTQLKAVAFKVGWGNSTVHAETYSVGDPSSDPCYPVAYFGCEGGGTNSASLGGNISLEASDQALANPPIAVYLYAGDQIVENVTTGNLYFQDSLGNTSHVTDAAGNLLESYTYSAFGIPTILSTNNTQLSTSAYGIKHLFQGQLWTQETGLNDYRNRVELPTMGIFLQPDPIGFKGDAANIYRFCNNNAVNRIDPMGLYPVNVIDFDRGLQGPGRDSAQRMAENNLADTLDKLGLSNVTLAGNSGENRKGENVQPRESYSPSELQHGDDPWKLVRDGALAAYLAADKDHREYHVYVFRNPNDPNDFVRTPLRVSGYDSRTNLTAAGERVNGVFHFTAAVVGNYGFWGLGMNHARFNKEDLNKDLTTFRRNGFNGFIKTPMPSSAVGVVHTPPYYYDNERHYTYGP